jgi:hypothetical protein
MRYETQMTPPDTTAMIFWLTNRMPDKWKNKQDVRADVGGNMSYTQYLDDCKGEDV